MKPSIQDWLALAAFVWGAIGQLRTWYLKKHQLPKPIQTVLDALASCGLSVEAIQAEIARIEQLPGVTGVEKRNMVVAYVLAKVTGLPTSTANFVVEYALELWEARTTKK